MVFIVCFCIIMFIGFNLFWMAQIRGWIPGTRIETYRVTQRYIEPSSRRFREGPRWISWVNSPSVETPGNHRLQVPVKDFDKYPIGASIEVVFIGNSTTPNLRNGIYSSNNMIGTASFCLFFIILGAFFSAHYYLTDKE